MNSIVIGLGASVMMPVFFTVLGVCVGVKFTKALKSGLLVGVGFVGLGVVTALLTSNLGPALKGMTELYHLNLPFFDLGWPAAAAVAYSCAVGAFIIPVCLGVNVNGIAPGYIATDNTAALRADPIFFAYGSNGVQRLREQVRDDSVLATNWKSLRARWTTPC